VPFYSAKNFQKFFSPFFRQLTQKNIFPKQLTLFFYLFSMNPYARLKAAANVRGFINHDTQEMKFSANFYSLQNKTLKTNYEQHYVNVKKENKKEAISLYNTN
jgi:hypothetical protein